VRKVLGDKVADNLLDQISDKAKKLNTDLQDTEKAFARLGIQSKSSLKDLADQAEKDFVRVKASGDATTDGLAEGWKKMATAAISANKGIAPEILKAQAATYKLRVEVDATGKSIITTMDPKPVQTMASAIRQTSDEVELLNTKYKLSSQYTERQLDLLLKQVAVKEKANQLAERAQALEDKRLGRDANKNSVDAKGNPIQSVNGYESRWVLNDAKSAGLSEAGAIKLFDGLKGNNNMILPGLMPEYYKQLNEQLALEARQRTNTTNPGDSAPLSTRYGSPSAAAAPAVIKTYNVVINGQTVRTASDADAQALIAVLRGAKLAA
jgi:hypothetical protein